MARIETEELFLNGVRCIVNKNSAKAEELRSLGWTLQEFKPVRRTSKKKIKNEQSSESMWCEGISSNDSPYN